MLALAERCPDSQDARLLELDACHRGMDMPWKLAVTVEQAVEEADALLERGQRLARELGDRHALAALAHVHAAIASQAGRSDGPQRMREALDLARTVGAIDVEINVIASDLNAAIAEGRLLRACELANECLERCGGDARLGVVLSQCCRCFSGGVPVEARRFRSHH